MLDSLQIDPIWFTIDIGGGFAIHWYGVIVAAGIGVGAWWAGREVRRRDGNPDELYNGLIVVVFAGFIFARLWYVLQEVAAGKGNQFNTLSAIVDVRAGGLSLLGGFVGALLVGTIYIRWRKQNFWLYADVAGPALLVAQALGRWGNFINQELYGPPTTLPWGILIDSGKRIAPFTSPATYPPDTRFHPTFLYESIWLLLGFAILTFANYRYRERWKSGTLFALFLMIWGGGRIWIDLFRPDLPVIGEGPITYSMIVGVIIAIMGVYLLLSRNNRLPEGGRARRRRRRRVRKPKPQRSVSPE